MKISMNIIVFNFEGFFLFWWAVNLLIELKHRHLCHNVEKRKKCERFINANIQGVAQIKAVKTILRNLNESLKKSNWDTQYKHSLKIGKTVVIGSFEVMFAEAWVGIELNCIMVLLSRTYFVPVSCTTT